MSFFKISRAFNKFTLNRQTLIKVQNYSSASIPSTKNLKVEKFNAIKNDDHFIVSEETTGDQFEVTFSWLRDHCRFIIFHFLYYFKILL